MAGKPDHERDYGTTKYLVDVDVDAGDLWLEVLFCRRCGAIVHDAAKHDDFHAYGGVRAAFGGI